MGWWSRGLTRSVVTAVVAGALVSSVGLAAAHGEASSVAPRADIPSVAAADLSKFDPGNIISDDLFFDGRAMSVAEIQAFLSAKVPNCAAGYTCLKDYRETTRTIAATPMCSRYEGAANETAATIIYRVALACGVSPKVILVVLQKEQGLVTKSAPSAYAYRSAMGAGCPDTADCDSAYYGFFNQVHYGAYLLKRYTQPPGTGPGTEYSTRFDLMKPVGQVSRIQYHPNTGCGTMEIYVANQATHSLYVYTPYTPNGAALAAGYGTGDSCSSYGNRNFYQYYTDWFGSTQGLGSSGEIGALHTRLGGTDGVMGAPTGRQQCGLKDGGCWQRFERGAAYVSPATSASFVDQRIWALTTSNGNENGFLGYPTMSTECGLKDGGCWQAFQGGKTYWSSAGGAHYVTPTMWAYTDTIGNENGILGYPLMDTACGLKNGGCWQRYQGGYLYYSPATGVHAVRPEIWALTSSIGNENGPLGYPTSDTVSLNSTDFSQTFQGGTVTYTPATGARITSTTDPWLSAVGANPWLGNALADRACGLKNGGCWQRYQGGYLYYSPATGVRAVRPEIWALTSSIGNENGPLGYPTADTVSLNSTDFSQTFQGGTVTYTPATGARVTSASDAWLSALAANPWLGNALADRACGLKNGGCWQRYQGGYLYYSPATGVHAVRPEIWALTSSIGNENGPLGYPTSDTVSLNSTDFSQTFQGGTVTYTPATGARVTSASDAWLSALAANPWLGNALADRACGLKNGGCWQRYQGGYLYYSPATGVRAVRPEIWALTSSIGNENGFLGYPTMSTECGLKDGGCWQAFQGGKTYWSSAGGAHYVTPTMWAYTDTIGNENGILGYPLMDTACGLKNGGCWQRYQGGYLYYSPATGVHAVRPEIWAVTTTLGNENGRLGYPTADTVAVSGGGFTQTYQGGTVAIAADGTSTVTYG